MGWSVFRHRGEQGAPQFGMARCMAAQRQLEAVVEGQDRDPSAPQRAPGCEGTIA